MADNNVTIDPRYSKHTNQEIERILDSVAEFDDAPTEDSDKPVKSSGIASAIQQAIESIPEADEESIRDIVRNWSSDEPEPEPEPGPEEEEEESGE